MYDVYDVMQKIETGLSEKADEAERAANASSEEQSAFTKNGRDEMLVRAATFREAREFVHQTRQSFEVAVNQGPEEQE